MGATVDGFVVVGLGVVVVLVVVVLEVVVGLVVVVVDVVVDGVVVVGGGKGVKSATTNASTKCSCSAWV